MTVTFGGMFREASRDLGRAAEELADRQRAVSSGRRFHGPSDDPHAAAGAIRERTEIATLDSYVKAADSGGSRLLVVDGVMSDLVTQVIRAQTAVTSGVGSSRTATDREAAANELEAVRDAVLSDLTATFSGTYLFSGAKVTTPPYTKDGAGNISAYAGSASTTDIAINRQTAVQASFDGDAITASDSGDNLLTLLTETAAALRANDAAAVETGLAQLQTVFDRLATAQSGVGAHLRQIDDERLRLQSLRVSSLARVSEHETVDPVEAALGLQAANRAYEAALTAVSARTRLSLMDFLR